jgi:hypothetical protein
MKKQMQEIENNLQRYKSESETKFKNFQTRTNI